MRCLSFGYLDTKALITPQYLTYGKMVFECDCSEDVPS